MKQKDEIIKIIENDIRESNITDNVLSILKTGLSVTKFSPFANLISEFIPNKRFLRLEKFTKELADDLNKLYFIDLIRFGKCQSIFQHLSFL